MGVCMQSGSNDAYKRKLGSEQWFEQNRTQPDADAEQEDQWAILRHEVEGVDMQRQGERMRSGWGDQRDTDEEAISSQSSYEIPAPATLNVDIVVVGVGGGGMNAINRMISAGVRGVRFVAMNTDAQVLSLCQAPDRICLGQHQTKGLGAGGNAAVGMRAATESADEIRAALGDADLVFIASGMGGGTGTGAAPIVASIAKKMGALTVGIVTIPFTFEGSRRRRIAEQGIAELRNEIDALITVPNDRLLSTVNRERSLSDAFKAADDVLRQGVQGIAEVINVPGMVNVDFADVRSVLCEAGTALMSIGQGKGRNRAQQAAEEAIAGGFLNVTIRGAKRVLFNISGGEDMTLFEVNEVAERIGAAIDDAADIIFGAVVDPKLGDMMRVTLIAAGMEELHTQRIEAIHAEAQRPTGQYQPTGPYQPQQPYQRPGGPRPTSPYPTPSYQTGSIPPVRQVQPRTPPVRPAPAPVAPPPPTQMPPTIRPRTNGQGQIPGRQQRSLNDLRGLRSMGQRPEEH
jgi:cell division protein FtsZ